MDRFSIRTIEISGFATLISGLHLPYGKDPVYYPQTYIGLITPEESGRDYWEIVSDTETKMSTKEINLLSRLVKSGDEHAKVLRAINVGVSITAPIWFYRELETYRIGRERISSESTMHIECKGLSGEELMEAKDKIDMGHIQRTIDTISYQTLRRIYFQRRHHRLPIWHQFCEWIESLPFAKELIIIEKPHEQN